MKKSIEKCPRTSKTIKYEPNYALRGPGRELQQLMRSGGGGGGGFGSWKISKIFKKSKIFDFRLLEVPLPFHRLSPQALQVRGDSLGRPQVSISIVSRLPHPALSSRSKKTKFYFFAKFSKFRPLPSTHRRPSSAAGARARTSESVVRLILYRFQCSWTFFDVVFTSNPLVIEWNAFGVIRTVSVAQIRRGTN